MYVLFAVPRKILRSVCCDSGENGLEQIKEDVLKLVMDDRLPKTTMGHRRVESLWVDHQIIGDALERYRLYVESEEQQKLRNYHTDNYAWTEEDIDRVRVAPTVYILLFLPHVAMFSFWKYGDVWVVIQSLPTR